MRWSAHTSIVQSAREPEEKLFLHAPCKISRHRVTLRSPVETIGNILGDKTEARADGEKRREKRREAQGTRTFEIIGQLDSSTRMKTKLWSSMSVSKA